MTVVYIAESYYMKGIARIYTFKDEAHADKFMSEHRQDGRKVWKKVIE